MYFHLKLMIYSEYMKFLRMLLLNYKKINVECNTTEAKKTIEAIDRQVNHKGTFCLCACERKC